MVALRNKQNGTVQKLTVRHARTYIKQHQLRRGNAEVLAADSWLEGVTVEGMLHEAEREAHKTALAMQQENMPKITRIPIKVKK